MRFAKLEPWLLLEARDSVRDCRAEPGRRTGVDVRGSSWKLRCDRGDDLVAESTTSESESESDKDKTLVTCLSASAMLLSVRDAFDVRVYRLDMLDA